MKYLKHIFVCIVLLSLGGYNQSLYAQIWLSDEDIFQEAEEYFNAEEYIESLPLYMLLEKKGVYNPHLAYKAGTCYLNTRGKKALAIPHLEYAITDVSDTFNNTFEETSAPLEALLSLGIAYRIQNRLDDAIATFEKLKGVVPDPNDDLVFLADYQIKKCENARMLNAFPNEPRTERFPDKINSMFSNYNPVLVGHDSILFYMDELKFYDALMQSKWENDEWSFPVNLTPSIGSDGDHILVGATTDGKQLFLYDFDPMRLGELYTTTYSEDEGWSGISPLNENINTVYHETHASISADGKTLYFTSNREGGYGGLDIYKSRYDSVTGDWGPARNLGPVINTPFNEESPIINTDDEILYFSSEGHLNMGGYDVFYSLRKGPDKWRQPINMGAPVSTTDDDLFYYPLEEHVSGLMSRLDNPASAYDIYRYNSMVFANTPRFNVQGNMPGVDTTNYKEYQIAVVNKDNEDTLQYFDMPPDGNFEILLPSGNFDMVFFIDDAIIDARNIQIGESAQDEILLATLPVVAKKDSSDKKPESNIASQAVEMQTDTLVLKPVLYAFDAYELNTESKEYLSMVSEYLVKYPQLNFLVEGHTDSKGSASYNLILSRKRAEQVVDYLSSKKVNKSRFTVEGKGETNPVALNSKADGTDNPEGRSYNRRVILIPSSKPIDLIVISGNEVPEALKVKP